MCSLLAAQTVGTSLQRMGGKVLEVVAGERDGNSFALGMMCVSRGVPGNLTSV